MTNTSGLRIGLSLPIFEKGGESPTWATIERFAIEAEAAGVDSLWLADDPFHRPFGLTDSIPVFSLIPTAAAVLAVTRSIHVGALVANVHFRAPAMLAKDADTLAILSDGRFILGLGAGGGDDRPQHEAMGAIWEKRYAAFEEAVEIITTLLRTGEADFVGAHYAAQGAVLAPRGPQPRGPEILIGGQGPRILRITAERADMWNAFFAGYRGLETLPPLLRQLDEACEKAGREPASLKRSVVLAVAFGDHPILAGSKVVPVDGIRGDPNRIADGILEVAALGISEIQVQLAPMNLWALERFAHVLSVIRG